MKNSGSLLKIIAAVAVLTLIVAIGIYINMPKTTSSSGSSIDMIAEFINPKTASAEIIWPNFPDLLAFLGLPKKVANPGTTLTIPQQRMFNAQMSALTWATSKGTYYGLTAAQAISKYYCTFFKSNAATAPKRTGGAWFVGFGGQQRLWVSTYSPIPNSEVPYMVDIWEKVRGIDVPNTPLTGLPTC